MPAVPPAVLEVPAPADQLATGAGGGVGDCEHARGPGHPAAVRLASARAARSGRERDPAPRGTPAGGPVAV